jgi:two-component sensor histidine kinase
VGLGCRLFTYNKQENGSCSADLGKHLVQYYQTSENQFFVMRKFFSVTAFLFFSATISAQTISPEEAKTLTRTLPGSKRDTAQINNLLKLAKYHIYKPGENKNDLDSAADLIKRAEAVNVIVRSPGANGYILLTKSYWLRESGQGEQARESARQATSILKDQANKALAGEAYFEYSGYFVYSNTEELGQRIRLVDTAVSFFQQAGDLERAGASLHMLGDLHNINGSPFIALQKLKQALDAYAAVHHEGVQGVHSLIGRIYNRLGDYKNAMAYQLLAMKTAEKVGDTSLQMCMINNDLAQTFLSLGDNQKAISYYEKALAIAEKYKDLNAIFRTGSLTATAWTKLNKPLMAIQVLDKLSRKYKKPDDIGAYGTLARTYIRSYCMLKEYKKAEPYCEKLLYYISTLDMNDYSNILCYAEVIWFYVHSRQFGLATKYLRKHQALTEKIDDLEQMANSQKLWFMLDTAQRNYRSAVYHQLTFKRLNDSLFNETKSQQIAELQVQYETEKKEKDILLKDQNIQSLTRNSELQVANFARERFTRNAIMIGAGLLFLVLLLLYRQYRLKQKSNTVITHKNEQLQHLLTEKEWLVKEIHHRVKNNLQLVMSLLNSQTAFVDNPFALSAIHESQHRVHAMSLLHQKLYTSADVSAIDMSIYIREMVSYLSESFPSGHRVRFNYSIEPIELDVGQAVPLGLILNEAITNALKYAFPDERRGEISISLSRIGEQRCLLQIADNGIGLPAQSSNGRPGSLGMSLMQGLSEDLDGSFSIESNSGTVITITFVQDSSVKRAKIFSDAIPSNN